MRKAFLLCAAVLCAVSAFAQTAFKPNDKITMTIQFDAPVEAGANVNVTYGFLGDHLPNQTQLGDRISFFGLSDDNKTFVLSTTVATNIASGEYKCMQLEIRKAGFNSASADQTQIANAPAFRIDDPQGKNPPTLKVPNFSIQVK